MIHFRSMTTTKRRGRPALRWAGAMLAVTALSGMTVAFADRQDNLSRELRARWAEVRDTWQRSYPSARRDSTVSTLSDTTVALADEDTDMLRELRMRWAEFMVSWQRSYSPQRRIPARFAPERIARTDKPAPALARTTQPQLVGISLNLAYVNTASNQYTRFRSWVDNAVGGNPGYAFEAADAAQMFRITRDPKYCTLAVNMAEQQVSTAEAAIAAGGTPAVAADSYLEVGQMIADVSLTYDTCASRLTSSQRQRWAAYAEQAVWNVWNPQSARWGANLRPWSGWSINNPGNNYHYSFLEATMYWALASNSQTWLDFLRNNKLPALQAYYAAIPGGGSLEGTGYGTAQMNLFELYRLWRDATGVDLANANPHANNTIAYWVHATVPTRDRFAPFGDQSRNSVPELYDYHRRLMLEARQLTTDTRARDVASWWLNNISVQQMSQGANLRYDMLPAGSGGTPPSELYYVAQGTGHVFARTGWDTGAMWMSYITGPYQESHAHQDQGAFTLFSGDWLAVTENIWSNSGIEQGTDVHNVVRFERSNPGAQQCQGPSNDRIVHQCAPSTSTMTVTPGVNGALTINSNLTPAYGGNPAVNSWTRQIDFANRKLTVRDNFSLGAGTTAFFQVNVPVQPVVSGREATAGRLRVRVLEPTNATISLRNWNSFNSGLFTRGWRIDVAGGTTTYLVELSEI